MEMGAGAQVYVRGQSVPLAPAIVEITREGVRLDTDPSTVIGWQDVKLVAGEHAEAAEVFAGIAERAWRARERIERRDYDLASADFAELFREYSKSDGPTSSMVARGHLACALHRDAYLAALAPFVVTLRDPSDGSIDPFVVPLDSVYSLAPELPPFWIPRDAPRAAGILSRMRPEEDEPAFTAHSIATLYLLAALDPDVPESEHERVLLEFDERDDASQFLNEILLARIGSFAQRREARELLVDRAESEIGTWVEAWCRIAIGRSLLREDGDGHARRAVLEFLSVPARFSDFSRLTELAMAFACDGLDFVDQGQHRFLVRNRDGELSQAPSSEFFDRFHPTDVQIGRASCRERV